MEHKKELSNLSEKRSNKTIQNLTSRCISIDKRHLHEKIFYFCMPQFFSTYTHACTQKKHKNLYLLLPISLTIKCVIFLKILIFKIQSFNYINKLLYTLKQLTNLFLFNILPIFPEVTKFPTVYRIPWIRNRKFLQFIYIFENVPYFSLKHLLAAK